jgi:hypothetical protein
MVVADVAIFRVTPIIIPVLDYSLGFAHTDLVTRDLQATAAAV